jgi:hypothetical protein
MSPRRGSRRHAGNLKGAVMTDKLMQVGRLAFREEGEYWNAYFAAEHTMDGALLLGSIRLGVARHSLHRLQLRPSVDIKRGKIRMRFQLLPVRDGPEGRSMMQLLSVDAQWVKLGEGDEQWPTLACNLLARRACARPVYPTPPLLLLPPLGTGGC